MKIFVVPKDDEQLDEKEIIDFCKGKLAKYRLPTIVEVRDELPKTAVGKILRRTLVDEELKKLQMNQLGG